MNDLQRALYTLLTSVLVAERLPSGRVMTDPDWWEVFHVINVLVDDDPLLEPAYTSGSPAETPPARPAPGS